MHGPDVAEVQRLLGVDADGELGPVTAAAIVAWKRSRGVGRPVPTLGRLQHRRLLADVPLRAASTMEGWAAAGVAEDPHGSNRVPRLISLAERLRVSPAFLGMGFPWCSFAVFLAALDAGGRTAALGLRDRAFNPLYTPTVLSEAEAGAFGLRIVQLADAFRGDLVLFDWDLARGDPAEHVGRLVEAPADGVVRTVDGNSGGDGVVALRERSNGLIRAFARDS